MKRLTFKIYWDDFLDNTIRLERGFFKTLIDLIRKPNIVISSYVDDRANRLKPKYISSIKLLVYSSIISALCSGLFFEYTDQDWDVENEIHVVTREIIESNTDKQILDKENQIYKNIYEIVGKNNILLSDIFINPFFIIIISLFSFVIAFKKNKYFFEHLTIATYYISIFVLFSTGAVLIELIPYGYYSDNIFSSSLALIWLLFSINYFLKIFNLKFTKELLLCSIINFIFGIYPLRHIINWGQSDKFFALHWFEISLEYFWQFQCYVIFKIALIS